MWSWLSSIDPARLLMIGQVFVLVGTVVGTSLITIGTINSMRSTDKATGSIQASTKKLETSVGDVGTQTAYLNTLNTEILANIKTAAQQTRTLEQLNKQAAQQLTELDQKIASLTHLSEEIQSISTGGNSRPLVRIQFINNQAEQRTTAQFNVDVVGRNPLRSLRVMINRVTTIQNGGAGGPGIYYQQFESFTGRGFDPRSMVGQISLEGDKAVFTADSTALNGYWNQVMRMRRIAGVWEWRSTVYVFSKDHPPIPQILSDEASPGFPAEEKHKPVLPITSSDISSSQNQ